MKIQNLLLPKVGVCTEQGLFYHRELKKEREIELIEKEGVLVFSKDSQLFFDAYFNNLSVEKWKKYSVIKKFSLVLYLKGDFEVRLVNNERVNDRTYKKFVSITRVSSKTKKLFIFPYDVYEYKGIFCYELKALSDNSVYYGGYYDGEVDEEDLHDVNIAINICTFKREAFVKRNIDLFNKYILQNKSSELYGHLRVYISDNGHTLPIEELESEDVRIVRNKNVGGAGGFSRGLIEIMKHEDEFPATHALMMDDDIQIEPESFIRTYAILRTRKPEYEDLFVGGAMLRNDDQAIQVESGSSWNAGALISNKAGLDLRDINKCLENEKEEYTEYNAWWYCATPLHLVNKENLPLPIFIRGDDLEFGLRNMKHLFLCNGICVWHEPFENKYSSSLYYYILRNLLYDNSLHFPNYSKMSFLKKLYGQVARELIYYRYKNVDLLFKGVDDFYKGVDFLKTTDGEKLNKEVMDLGYKGVPGVNIEGMSYRLKDFQKSVYEGVDVVDANGIRLGENESKIKKIFRLLTLNGYLLPSKNTNRVVSMFLCRPINFYRERRVLNYDPIAGKGFVTEKKWGPTFKATGKLIKETLRTLFKFNKAKKEFKDRIGEITNEQFWNTYLDEE